jgi:Flp pilus assembly pilin Flp
MAMEPRQHRWNRFGRFRRDEGGAMSIELAILFPVFMALLVAAFELGMYMTRQTMLERAVDITVRSLRLGQMPNPDHDTLRDSICDRAERVLPGCRGSLLIDIVEVPLQGWTPPNVTAECIERDPDGELKPVSNFILNPGSPNNMMLIRVCSLQQPIFPTTYMGLAMQSHDDFYALTTSSAFVVEPSNT